MCMWKMIAYLDRFFSEFLALKGEESLQSLKIRAEAKDFAGT